MLRAAEAVLGCRLVSKPVDLGTCRLVLDGRSDKPRVLCEAFARVGSIKPAHEDKVMKDALRLFVAGRMLGRKYRKVLLFMDERVAGSFRKGWKAAALKVLGVELLVVDVNRQVRESVVAAQGRQATGSARRRVARPSRPLRRPKNAR
jgi:hypothetical protein